MKKIRLILSLFAVVSLMAFTILETVNWKVKENYAVTFKGGKVNGGFKGLKAIIAFDEANPERSKIWASIDVSSVNTGMGIRDKHTLSENALDAKNFPLITFESASVTKTATGYEAKGTLTIKGIKKEISLPFTFENGGAESIFKGKFIVITKDFNITKSGTADRVEVELDIPVTK